MPDIAMCARTTCLRSTTCYRSKNSGTKPSEHRQAYFLLGDDDDETGENCSFYWPTEKRK